MEAGARNTQLHANVEGVVNVSSTERIAITGTGAAVGDIIRTNDDPVFAYVIANPPPNHDIFAGLKDRRVLGPGQTVTSIAVAAAREALLDANIAAAEVDLLIGAATMGQYLAPSPLAEVHAQLGLPGNCRVLALNTEYTAFVDALKVANDMIAAGSVKCALVVSSSAWTSHMDYHEAVCVAASDGAGAAVVTRTTDATRFALVDWENQTDTSYYGAFRMTPRPVAVPPHFRASPTIFTAPMMALDPVRGGPAVKNFGLPVPVAVVNRLLARNSLTAQDIALVPHQTSQMVASYWQEHIAPAVYISTMEDYADMVSASAAVNLATCREQITQQHMVIMGIGMEMRATALLYSRTV